MKIVLNGWFLTHDVHTGTGQYLRAAQGKTKKAA